MQMFLEVHSQKKIYTYFPMNCIFQFTVTLCGTFKNFKSTEDFLTFPHNQYVMY